MLSDMHAKTHEHIKKASVLCPVNNFGDISEGTLTNAIILPNHTSRFDGAKLQKNIRPDKFFFC